MTRKRCRRWQRSSPTNACHCRGWTNDEGVDTGPLIAHLPLENPCGYENIWQVKAASYLSAFSLLNHYLRKKDAFTRTDILKHTHKLGPEYKARDFTDEVKLKAEENYQTYRLMPLILRQKPAFNTTKNDKLGI